jgi:NDP-sugar pyrophosphorylase family protein
MKAMILAAGLGTRLRPLTNDRPKALVTVGGRTLLEIALSRLRVFGVDQVIVNTHYFGEMIHTYLRVNNDFGMRIEMSHEESLLDTGGGLKQAAWFFTETADDWNEPFILHNVDVVSTIDLRRMLEFHSRQGALATLAVQDRVTSRYLLFDERDELCGRRDGRDGQTELARPAVETHALAFSGIHVLSRYIFSKIKEEGAFSIISAYLRLAANGGKIIAFPSNEYEWRDLGRPENVVQVAREIESGMFPVG